MNQVVSNSILAALAAGLTFPIQAKVVGSNGTTAQLLCENAEEWHTLSVQLPINFPAEWTLTGANQRTVKFIQTVASAQELLDRSGNRRLN